jgi:hypothetical protein
METPWERYSRRMAQIRTKQEELDCEKRALEEELTAADLRAAKNAITNPECR